ncbi:MAG TPA: SCP2 sterol-binding domain-containing protein [Rhodocyclaceae bacterium]|nr:SCP2 sterol-binding domain-containing protein [Rhodocyclaceae bacterium]
MLDRVALAILNHLLADEPWARARLKPYAGRTARLTLPPWRLDLAVDERGLVAASGAAADVEITLPVAAPFLLFRGMDALTKEVHVVGSAEFADTLGFVLPRLRWDFEGDLAGRIGGIAARRIAGLFEALAAWQIRAGRNLAENVAEYLTEEKPVLARAADAADFAREVGRLEEDLLGLERRLPPRLPRT